MTKKELIGQLKNVPDDFEILKEFSCQSTYDGWKQVEVEKITVFDDFRQIVIS